MITPIGQSIANNSIANDSVANTGLQDTLDQLNTPSVLSGEGGLGSLGQTDFLRLLTTQLSNQDPLEPQSNEAMIAQLAQFSSLEAQTDTATVLNEINDKLDQVLFARDLA